MCRQMSSWIGLAHEGCPRADTRFQSRPDDTSQLPFNAFAQRYVSYRKSIVGDQDFIGGLQAAMIQAITPAPYVPPARRSVAGRECIRLFTPVTIYTIGNRLLRVGV
jgi:hypothetical protein